MGPAARRTRLRVVCGRGRAVSWDRDRRSGHACQCLRSLPELGAGREGRRRPSTRSRRGLLPPLTPQQAPRSREALAELFNRRELLAQGPAPAPSAALAAAPASLAFAGRCEVSVPRAPPRPDPQLGLSSGVSPVPEPPALNLNTGSRTPHLRVLGPGLCSFNVSSHTCSLEMIRKIGNCCPKPCSLWPL